jgi:hypothetical protein
MSRSHKKPREPEFPITGILGALIFLIGLVLSHC